MWQRIICVGCPDTDLEALGLAFHGQGPTFINAYTVKLLQTWLIKTEGEGDGRAGYDLPQSELSECFN